MSHIVSIQTKVHDPTAVAAACQRLGQPALHHLGWTQIDQDRAQVEQGLIGQRRNRSTKPSYSTVSPL